MAWQDLDLDLDTCSLSVNTAVLVGVLADSGDIQGLPCPPCHPYHLAQACSMRLALYQGLGIASGRDNTTLA